MGRTDSRRRALFLLIVFATVGSALLARLAYWQVGQRDRLADEAFQQTTMREETPSKRGEIYDRTGVVVLATTIERQRLVSVLGLTGEDAQTLTDRETSERKYVVLAHALDSTVAGQIQAAITSGSL